MNYLTHFVLPFAIWSLGRKVSISVGVELALAWSREITLANVREEQRNKKQYLTGPATVTYIILFVENIT